MLGDAVDLGGANLEEEELDWPCVSGRNARQEEAGGAEDGRRREEVSRMVVQVDNHAVQTAGVDVELGLCGTQICF